MQGLIFLLSVISTVACLYVMSQVAPKRGRSIRLWVALAFVFGWLTFIPLYLLPNKQAEVKA